MPNPLGGPNKYQAGVSGNPAGRPPQTPEERALRKVNRKEFEELVNILLHTSVEELQTIANDKTNTGMTMMLASIIAKAIKYGDQRRMDFFLNRLIGKVPERFEGPNGEPMSFIGLVQLAGTYKKDEDTPDEQS